MNESSPVLYPYYQYVILYLTGNWGTNAADEEEEKRWIPRERSFL